MKLKDKKIFISGGNGVIGNALVERLHEHGAIIFVGDLKPRPKDWESDILYRQGDLNFITKEELDAFGPQIFIHLAATFERSTETYDFWNENKWHNVHLSTYLMTLLKDSTTLQKVIFASSYLIYDKQLYTFENPANIPRSLNEIDPIMPRNLTGAAKLNHEIELRFLQSFNDTYYKTISARIYRSYGKYSRDVISRWIRALLIGNEITVYKKEGLFDFIFADDVAEGLIRLSMDDQFSGIVNLGRGKARRVSEVLEVLKQYFPNMKYIEKDQDIPYEASQADMSLFEKITGWRPSQDIETTIPKMIDYEKQIINYEQDEKLPINLFISSISKKVPLTKAVSKAIDKISLPIKVFGGDYNSESIGKYFVDEFWHMPKTINDNKKIILDYIKEKKINIIVPTRDGELLFWAQIKNENPSLNILISNSKSIELCLDKLMFYCEMHKKGFPVIHTSEKIIDIAESNKYVVKERFGAGSVNIGLNLNKDEALLVAKKLVHPIYQPFIEGEEYSVDLYISKKRKVKGAIVRRRDFIVSGESQITTTVENKDILEMSIQFVEALELYGHVVLQVIQKENKNYIIECNSRFGGASTLSISAGLDSFFWFLLESNNVNIDDYPFLPTKKAIKQIRYPEDIVLS